MNSSTDELTSPWFLVLVLISSIPLVFDFLNMCMHKKFPQKPTKPIWFKAKYGGVAIVLRNKKLAEFHKEFQKVRPVYDQEFVVYYNNSIYTVSVDCWGNKFTIHNGNIYSNAVDLQVYKNFSTIEDVLIDMLTYSTDYYLSEGLPDTKNARKV